jgi:hypothetical protein
MALAEIGGRGETSRRHVVAVADFVEPPPALGGVVVVPVPAGGWVAGSGVPPTGGCEPPEPPASVGVTGLGVAPVLGLVVPPAGCGVPALDGVAGWPVPVPVG